MQAVWSYVKLQEDPLIADRIAERVLRHQRQRGRYNSTKELAEAVGSWIRQEAMDVEIFQTLELFSRQSQKILRNEINPHLNLLRFFSKVFEHTLRKLKFHHASDFQEI